MPDEYPQSAAQQPMLVGSRIDPRGDGERLFTVWSDGTQDVEYFAGRGEAIARLAEIEGNVGVRLRS